jgi:hypothetical protein
MSFPPIKDFQFDGHGLSNFNVKGALVIWKRLRPQRVEMISRKFPCQKGLYLQTKKMDLTSS